MGMRERTLTFRMRSGLLVLNLLVIVLVVVILFSPSNILRILLGLPFVLFFPGYALMAALFPRKARMSGIERVALSFGLSIAAVSLIGLILNYTPWGIRLESMLGSTVSAILIMSVVAWVRQRRLPEEERYDIGFQPKLPNWGTSAQDRGLSIILVLAVVGALGMAGYLVVAPEVGEKLTEYYFLGPEDETASGMLEPTHLDTVVGRAEVRDIIVVGRTTGEDVSFVEQWGRLAIVVVLEGVEQAPTWVLREGISVMVWRGEE